ncbi:uncharacterized protein MYCFIDRAFT_207149 [Pseudocercospora fijiensis CIRAD86]|uniref:Uncharacterized protein n=1 Tax=Pseudocercospora fijiensis (strain CIRAD86) TaxID=383855 RepID=M3B3V5_PSEFD|nr:uncharacterized protein MYCFIDRAFT_207149 [Pseudocercospora fijiensis CIRAD86]EME84052.1 hypothetical protein MYCFIDRAFT_207149 [Pseudocercospora fijiensis CIRAD86]
MEDDTATTRAKRPAMRCDTILPDHTSWARGVLKMERILRTTATQGTHTRFSRTALICFVVAFSSKPALAFFVDWKLHFSLVSLMGDREIFEGMSMVRPIRAALRLTHSHEAYIDRSYLPAACLQISSLTLDICDNKFNDSVIDAKTSLTTPSRRFRRIITLYLLCGNLSKRASLLGPYRSFGEASYCKMNKNDDSYLTESQSGEPLFTIDTVPLPHLAATLSEWSSCCCYGLSTALHEMLCLPHWAQRSTSHGRYIAFSLPLNSSPLPPQLTINSKFRALLAIGTAEPTASSAPSAVANMSDRLSRSPSARSKRKTSTKHRPSLSAVPEDMGDTRADEADALLSLQSRQPGRNAFSEEALRHNRYMLATNAFVQQEFSRRENTPPSIVHPALRHNFNLLDTAQPLPTLDPEEVARHMATLPRDSDVTTMSPFLAAGQEESPVLDLGTTPENTPQPTQRAFIEDRRESHDHKQLGREEQRVPVYTHTPKPAAEEFATPQTTSTRKTDEIKAQQQTPATKSPKKGFFSRLGWSARSKAVTPQPIADGVVESPDGTQMSVKARAMLVDPPPIRGLIRSPSKPKGLFSRRTSDAADITSATKRSDPPRAATSLGHRTPQNITWQLPRSTSKKKLDAARKANDERTQRNTQANTALGRSHSLKHQDDGKAPPTPPAKDTPPEVLAQRRLAQQSQLAQSISNDTPTRTPQVVTPSISITPTSRQASFGNRGQGTLVTQASMYSMRASVVADAMDPSAFNDAKSRINALGIEGFSMPNECNQRRSVIEYSPSAYSPDTNRNSVLHFPGRAGSRMEKKLQLQTSMNTLREPAHNAQDSLSTTGTIPVFYPELAKDPSIASFMEYDSSILMPPEVPDSESPSPQPGEFDRAYIDVQNMVKDETVESPVSAHSEASTEGLFAIPLKRTPQRPEQSPMTNHPSAMPSPLRNSSGEAYLPSSTFQPPVPWPKRDAKTPQRLRLQKVSEEQKISDSLPSPDELPWTPGGRPKPKPSIFDNRPNLTRPKDLVIRQSPPMGRAKWLVKPNDNIDPEKSPRAHSSPSPRAPSSLQKSRSKDSDQFQELSDRVLSMAQDYESKIEELNDSARAENARLHQRLASIEIATAIPKPEICFGGGGDDDDTQVPGSGSRRTSAEKKRHVSASEKKKKKKSKMAPEKRVSTGIAQDFYRAASKGQSHSPVDSIATTEKSTIILTPNLPRPDSQTVLLPQPAASSSSPAPPSVGSDTGVDRLFAIVERQQQMMMDMMQEIRDLKRQGGGGGGDETSLSLVWMRLHWRKRKMTSVLWGYPNCCIDALWRFCSSSLVHVCSFVLGVMAIEQDPPRLVRILSPF